MKLKGYMLKIASKECKLESYSYNVANIIKELRIKIIIEN